MVERTSRAAKCAGQAPPRPLLSHPRASLRRLGVRGRRPPPPTTHGLIQMRERRSQGPPTPLPTR